jgi:hypothetical protein
MGDEIELTIRQQAMDEDLLVDLGNQVAVEEPEEEI